MRTHCGLDAVLFMPELAGPSPPARRTSSGARLTERVWEVSRLRDHCTASNWCHKDFRLGPTDSWAGAVTSHTRTQILAPRGTWSRPALSGPQFPPLREKMSNRAAAPRPPPARANSNSWNETWWRANCKLFEAALSDCAACCFLAGQSPPAAGTGRQQRTASHCSLYGPPFRQRSLLID